MATVGHGLHLQTHAIRCLGKAGVRLFLTSTLATVFFLLPLTMYFFWLGMVNRRDTPLVVPGLWDAFGLVLGLIGLLGTFPILLQTWFTRIATTPIQGNQVADLDAAYFGFWLIVVGFYMLVVVGIVALLLSRRHQTVVYNVDTDGFPDRLQRAVHALGWPGTIDDLKMEIRVDDARFAESNMSLPKAPSDRSAVRLRWDHFGAFCNVTLHWHHYAAAEKERFERALEKILTADARPAENAASTWFLGVGGLLFGFLCFLAVFTILILAVPRRF